MKKYNYLPIFLFILSLIACSGIESKIEEKIKTSLDDPSSFELISIISSDTLELKNNSHFLRLNVEYKELSTIASKTYFTYRECADREARYSKETTRYMKELKELGYGDRMYDYYRDKFSESYDKETEAALLTKDKYGFYNNASKERDVKGEKISSRIDVKGFDIVTYYVEFRGANKFGALIKANEYVVVYNGNAYLSKNKANEALYNDLDIDVISLFESN